MDQLFARRDDLLSVVDRKDHEYAIREFYGSISHPSEELSKRLPNGQTLLHFAAGYGKGDVVKALVRAGAPVNARDGDGSTPLHNASCHGHFRTSKVLIKGGADVNLTDGRGWTALHFALARRNNTYKISPEYLKLVNLLIEAGANPHLRSLNHGRRPIDLIHDLDDKCDIIMKHLTMQLESAGASANRDEIIHKFVQVDDFFNMVKLGDQQLEALQTVTTPLLLTSHLESFGNITPLHRAAGYNHIETARFFIERGAPTGATDGFGRTPLHNAAQYGHVDMIELLVERGLSINQQDTDGYSPLHVSALSKTFHACLKLIELGANVDLRCHRGKLPYDLAISDDIKEVLKPNALRYRVATTSSTSNDAIYIDDLRSNLATYSTVRYVDSDVLMLDSKRHEFRFSNPQFKIKIETIPETDRRYKLIKKRMLDTIVLHTDESCGNYTSYDIISIEFLQHKIVWEKYKLACSRLELDCAKNERLLFHGSSFINTIQSQGFDERYAQRDGMFGAGIYFAEHSSKSNQYTFGWGQGCEKHQDKSCALCERKMIYAQVALGKSRISGEAMICAHAPPGYHSVSGTPNSAEGLKYPEYVIYSGDQAYPLFIITYRIKKDG